MANIQKPASKFTPEEEQRIQAEVKANLDKQRQAQIDAEIRNRTLDSQRQQPGRKYY